MKVIRIPNTECGYTFVIHSDGTIYQTRKLSEEGAHTIGMNKRSIGVCFMGNFDEHKPTPKQMATWSVLYNELQEIYPNIPTRPHRAYATKSCHGKLLSDDYFASYSIKLDMIGKLRQIVAILTTILTNRRMK